jgi:SAM-dependent methyltransferase
LFNGKAIDVYHGADIDAKHEVEVEELSGRISTADESYDLVVHFQALEHVQRANELLAECYRVLRPGGTLFCTVPSIFEYHGVPDDYRRWTRRGIEADLQGAGFEEVSTIAVEGDWESVLTILELFFPRAVLCEEDRVFRGEALFPLCESAVVSSAWQSNSFVPAHHRCTGAETAELSAIEQMMRSRLVIAADIGGLSDIVDDPGPKFPAAHANGLARCLEQVLKTPNLATEMGEKARQRALSLFGQERMVAEHLDT